MAYGKFSFFSAFLALVILASVAASAYYIAGKVNASRVQMRTIEQEPPPIPIDPGESEFKTAMRLVTGKEYLAAKGALDRILEYYPDSPKSAEAKRILGEINLDLLLCGEFEQGQATHEVVEGDQLIKLARKYDTSLEYIRVANGMKTLAIHPGEKLLVHRLLFDIRIDVSGKRLAVYRDGKFFKEYPVAAIKLPEGVSTPFVTTVHSKLGSWKGKTVKGADKNYSKGSKLIQLERPGVAIRPSPQKEAAPGAATPKSNVTGIFMENADVEELNILVTGKTKVSFGA